MSLLRRYQELTVMLCTILVLSLLGCSGSGVKNGDKGGESDAKPQTATSSVRSAQVISPAQARLLGDLDDDGAPTVGDTIKILRIVVGLDPDDECADANESGTTDVGDAIKVLRCVVGLDTWPIGECGGGEVTYEFVTTWGSYGSGDGQFQGAAGVAVDAAGNVYVADDWNHRIQKFTSNGTFITKWGSEGHLHSMFF